MRTLKIELKIENNFVKKSHLCGRSRPPTRTKPVDIKLTLTHYCRKVDKIKLTVVKDLSYKVYIKILLKLSRVNYQNCQ